MLELGYFPGCSLHKSARNYEESVNKLFEVLGIRLTEVEDWNCCGASSAHFTDEGLAVGLSARNLALAEEQGHHTLFAPCAACYNRLLTANKVMSDQEPEAKEVNELIAPQAYNGTVEVRNLLDVLSKEVGPLELANHCQVPLKGLKVAAYYGCLLVRSPGIGYFEDRENPTSMEKMLEAMGAETVDWPAKTDCCGASMAATQEEITNKWNGNIMDMARRSGANCIATACPLCQTNLDMYQWKMGKSSGQENMPIFFLSELLALAAGAKIGGREWRKHFIRPDALLQELTINAST